MNNFAIILQLLYVSLRLLDAMSRIEICNHKHFATCKSKNDPHGRELISKIEIANEKAWNCLNFDRAADHCAKPRQKINTRAKV